MPKEKIWIGISKKQVEKEIEKIVKEYVRKLVSYDYVKSVFYSELQKFVQSKIKKKNYLKNCRRNV